MANRAETDRASIVSELEITNTMDLATLADQINAEHRACDEALREGLAHAVRAGELLVEAKAQVKHGQWEQWVTENFEGSPRTAQAYMKVAREIPTLDGAKAQRVADLSFRGALKELSVPVVDEDNDVANREELGNLIREVMETFGPNLWEEEKPLFERRLAAPGPQEEELLKTLNVEWLHQLANQVAVDGFLLEVKDKKPVLTYRTPDKSKIYVVPVPTSDPDVRGNIERGTEVDAVCNFMVWRHLENWLTAVVAAESTDTDVILRRVEHNADWRRAGAAGEFLREQWSEHRRSPKDFAAERGLALREFEENLSAVRVWVSVQGNRWVRMLTGETKEDHA